MPTISAFFGITIRMYLRDHPPPHFHAHDGEHRALVAIATGDITEGRLPSVARRLVRERTLAHRPDLADGWERARAGLPLERIAGWDVIDVIGLERLGAFRLRVEFSDGSAGERDSSAMVAEHGPMLDPLRDAAYFDRVVVEFGAPTWPNGFDLAPEWLRREMAAAGELRRSAAA